MGRGVLRIALYSAVVSALVSLLTAWVGFYLGAENVSEPAVESLQFAIFLFQALLFFVPCFICGLIVGGLVRRNVMAVENA